MPYLNYQKGIYRAAVQSGPAALSIQTSYRSPYADHDTADGYLYDYRAGADGERDNRALRAACELQVPLVHFVGTCDLPLEGRAAARRGAHLTDAADGGQPAVSNGVSLCSIHHRAFDNDLVGLSPDYRVAVSRKLLDDEDGPMLELLKRFHGSTIEVPARRQARPAPERLGARFERFLAASGS